MAKGKQLLKSVEVQQRIKEIEKGEQEKKAKDNLKREELLDYFQKNQERWVHSVDFLRKGEISEKDLLLLKPLTDQKTKTEDNEEIEDLDGETYAKMGRA